MLRCPVGDEELVLPLKEMSSDVTMAACWKSTEDITIQNSFTCSVSVPRRTCSVQNEDFVTPRFGAQVLSVYVQFVTCVQFRNHDTFVHLRSFFGQLLITSDVSV